MRFDYGFPSANSSQAPRRKSEKSRERRRHALASFASMESLEIRSLLTAIPPVITNLRLAEDTLLAGDNRTSNPIVEVTLADPDWNGSDYRVEVDLDSDGIYDTSFEVTPGTPFQFDPSPFVTYGALSLTFRGIEYSESLEEDVRGSAETFSFDFLNPNSVVGNDAPNLTLTNLPSAAIPENQSFVNRLKVADLAVTDDGVGTNAISLAGPDAQFFEIDGTELFVRAGTSLDFESLPLLEVHVLVDDQSLGEGPEVTAILMIGVGDVNESPVVKLPNSTVTVPEIHATPTRVKISDLIVSDDALGSYTLTLSGHQASSFEIDGTELFLKAGATLDYEFSSLVNLFIQADDPTIGTTYDSSVMLTVIVTNVDEAPVVATSFVHSQAFPENRRFDSRFEVARFSVVDDAIGTYVMSLTGTDASSFEIDGNSVYLKSGTLLDYETNPSLDVTLVASDIVDSNLFTSVVLSFAVSDITVQSFADVLTVGNDYRGTPIVLDVLANDFSDVGTLAITSVGTPNHGMATIVNSSTGTNDRIRYVAPIGFTGTVTFTYQVLAGSQTSQSTITLEVVESEDVNRDPVVTVLSVTTIAGQPVSIRPLRGVDDLDGDDLEIVGTPTASHGTVQVQTDSNGETVFVYTPSAGYQGSDTISFVVGDEYGLTTNATVAVTVSHQAVKAVSDRYQVVTGTTLNANSTAMSGTARSVLVNDLIPSGVTATAALVSGPSHGTLTLQTNGTFSYTPNSGYTGTDSFSYKVHDGIGYGDPQTVEIVVNASGTQTGPNGNIASTSTSDAGGAYGSTIDVTVFNGNYDIDPTSRFLATGITTGSDAFTDTQTYTDSTTDENNVTTNSETVLDREKTVFSSVNGNGEWFYLETYSITFDVTMTVPGVSTSHVFGVFSYTFQAWGDSTFSAYNFSTVSGTNGSGTYLTSLGESDLTIAWTDSEYSTQTVTNTTYFTSNLSLGSQGGFSQRAFSYLGTGPYEYEIEGGTVTGTISIHGMESSLASAYVNYAKDDNLWVAQGVGTSNAMTIEFSSAAGSGNFQLTKNGENGLVTSITGTLSEKDDEVTLSNTTTIYLMAPSGWELASGAGTGNYTNDSRETIEKAGTYSYPIVGDMVYGTTSGRSVDTSKTTAFSLAFVVAGEWQSSGEAHVIESGEEYGSYSGSGIFTTFDVSDDDSSSSTTTTSIFEYGSNSSDDSLTMNYVLDSGEWELANGQLFNHGSGNDTVKVTSFRTFEKSTDEIDLQGREIVVDVLDSGFEYETTTTVVNDAGILIWSGIGNVTEWGGRTIITGIDSTYIRNYQGPHNGNQITSVGNITSSTLDSNDYIALSSLSLVGEEWVQTAGSGLTTASGNWDFTESAFGIYERIAADVTISGEQGEAANVRGTYEFQIDSEYVNDEWIDSGTKNEHVKNTYFNYFSGSGSESISTTDSETNESRTIHMVIEESGFDLSEDDVYSQYELDDASEWDQISGSSLESGFGWSNKDSTYTGTYERTFSGGSVSGTINGFDRNSSSYSYDIFGSIVAGEWFYDGLLDSLFSGAESFSKVGTGSLTTTEEISTGNTVQVTNSVEEKTGRKGDYRATSSFLWIDDSWELNTGSASTRASGKQSFESDGTAAYTRTIAGGSVSGTLKVTRSDQSDWDTNTTSTVVDGDWDRNGTGSGKTEQKLTKSLDGSGSFVFTDETSTTSGTVTESTHDNVRTYSKIESSLAEDEETWTIEVGHVQGNSNGKSTLRYQASTIYEDEEVEIDDITYTGTMVTGAEIGASYDSYVHSDYLNGEWTSLEGTATVDAFSGQFIRFDGQRTFTTSVNGVSVTDLSTFFVDFKMRDHLVTEYELDSEEEWESTETKHFGFQTFVFEESFDKSGVQYTRDLLSEPGINGTGTITGTVSVQDKKNVDIDITYEFDGSGEDREVIGGTMKGERNSVRVESYDGTGTYTRTLADSAVFIGNVHEQGTYNKVQSKSVEYSLDEFEWVITGGKAKSNLTDIDTISAGGNLTREVDGTPTVAISTAGVAIYYVALYQGVNPVPNGNSAGYTTTVTQDNDTTSIDEDNYQRKTSVTLNQSGSLTQNNVGDWDWSFTGAGSSTNSGSSKSIVKVNQDRSATSTWNAHNASFTATSSEKSKKNTTESVVWNKSDSYAFVDGDWTKTGSKDFLTVSLIDTYTADRESELNNSGGNFTIDSESSQTANENNSAFYTKDYKSGSFTDASGTVTSFYSPYADYFEGDANRGHNSLTVTDTTATDNFDLDNDIRKIKNDFDSYTSTDSISRYFQVLGSVETGTSSGNYINRGSHNGSDGPFSTMFGVAPPVIYSSNWNNSGPTNSYYIFGENLKERFESSVANPSLLNPDIFTTPPQTHSFTTPDPLIMNLPPLGPIERPSPLESIFYFVLEYGVEVMPVAGPSRSFNRAYNEGSGLGMLLSIRDLGLDLSRIGPVAKGGKFAIKGLGKGLGKVASHVKPLASLRAAAAKSEILESLSYVIPRVNNSTPGIQIPSLRLLEDVREDVRKFEISAWWRRIQAGRKFNEEQKRRYEHNELYIEKGNGKRGYYRLDSYNHKTGEIVSRKFTQFDQIQEDTAIMYLSELAKKYPVGAKIADVRSTSPELKGKLLNGRLILEIPVQNKEISEAIRKAATERQILIRDIAGKVYNVLVPD